jgi:hypothetical protein
MMKGKPMVIHGLKNKLTVQSLRISPRALVRAIAASLNPRPPAKGVEGPAPSAVSPP